MLKEQINNNNIKQDRYDETLFSELTEVSGKLNDVLSTPPIAHEPWKAIIKDFWAGFYKFSPELNHENLVDPLYLANRPFVEKFIEDPATVQTRIYTMLDELSAGMATIAAAQKLNEELNSRPDLKQKFEQFFSEQQKTNGPDEEAVQQIKSDLQALSREVRRSVAEAIKAGQNQVENLNDLLKNWGLEPADLKTVPLGKRIELANFLSNNRKVKELTQIIGRFRNLARSRQKEKVKTRRDDIHSITLGNDLNYVLPAELVAVTHPVLKLDFYRKYIENSLLQYELKSNEPKGRGPMVIAVDVSESMSDNRKIDHAIATALALVDTASRQKRKAGIIFFNQAIVKELEFSPREKNIEKLMQIAQVGAAGGTNFDRPLKRSLELIKSSNYQKADLVFITDGLCEVDPAFLTEFMMEKTKLEFKVYSILLDVNSDSIEKWSDQIWAVPTNINEDTAGELFEAVF